MGRLYIWQNSRETLASFLHGMVFLSSINNSRKEIRISSLFGLEKCSIEDDNATCRDLTSIRRKVI